MAFLYGNIRPSLLSLHTRISMQEEKKQNVIEINESVGQSKSSALSCVSFMKTATYNKAFYPLLSNQSTRKNKVNASVGKVKGYPTFLL